MKFFGSVLLVKPINIFCSISEKNKMKIKSILQFLSRLSHISLGEAADIFWMGLKPCKMFLRIYVLRDLAKNDFWCLWTISYSACKHQIKMIVFPEHTFEIHNLYSLEGCEFSPEVKNHNFSPILFFLRSNLFRPDFYTSPTS
jgi:hypothetical protein